MQQREKNEPVVVMEGVAKSANHDVFHTNLDSPLCTRGKLI